MNNSTTYYLLLTSIYTGTFLVLGIILLAGRIPRHQNLRNYRISRYIFGCAYLLLGITGCIELCLFPSSERNYLTFYITFAISIFHAWLNAYAYLMMLNPSEKKRRHFLLYGRTCLPLIVLAGAVTLFFPGYYRFSSILLGAIYVVQIVLMLWICKAEYKACVRSLNKYYDDTPRFGWMNLVINLTLVLAFFNLLSFYFSVVEFPLRIINVAFYVYFAIRILDYIPMFLHIEEMQKMEDNTPVTIVDTNDVAPKQEELLPRLIEKWIKTGEFCQNPLPINDAAIGIGTNRCYLSTYLNRQIGTTYRQWLNGLRIEQAKTLLHERTDLTVSEIGKMVGIPEAYKFSYWFKNITGHSPVQWRKRHVPTTTDKTPYPPSP